MGEVGGGAEAVILTCHDDLLGQCCIRVALTGSRYTSFDVHWHCLAMLYLSYDE